MARIHPLGTLNVCTKCIGNPFYYFFIFDHNVSHGGTKVKVRGSPESQFLNVFPLKDRVTHHPKSHNIKSEMKIHLWVSNSLHTITNAQYLYAVLFLSALSNKNDSVCTPVIPSHPQLLFPSFSFWRYPSGAVSRLWSSSSSSLCPAGGARRKH